MPKSDFLLEAESSNGGKRRPVIRVLIPHVVSARHCELCLCKSMRSRSRVVRAKTMKTDHQFCRGVGIDRPQARHHYWNASDKKRTSDAEGTFTSIIMFYSGLAS